MIIIGGTPDDWGIIPSFLNESDPRPARDQINAHYTGGWNSFKGFEMDLITYELIYPGDPPYEPLSMLVFRSEMLIIYPSAWVVIMQRDRSWDVARLD